MSNAYHQDLYDLGLAQLSNTANWQGGTLTLCVCKGQPATRAEAATAFPTGKRITAEVALAGADVALANRAGGGREITTAQKTGVAVVSTTVAGDDLHYALYDGARLLAVLDEPSNKALTAGDPCTIPAQKLGFGAP